MARVPRARLTLPAVAGPLLNEGLGFTGARGDVDSGLLTEEAVQKCSSAF
jgi:hypothetical protein